MSVTKTIKRKAFPLYASRGWARAPQQITLDLTHKCNLRCFWCFYHGIGTAVKHGPESKPVPVELLMRNAIDRFSCSSYYLTGGEPFLYPELLQLLRYLKEKRKDVLISTNGTLIDEAWAERIVKEALIKRVNASIHGPQEVHDEISGVKGAFQRAADGIKALLRFREGAGTTYPQINVACTVSERNIGHLNELTTIVKGWGVDSMNFGNPAFTTPEIVECHQTFSRKVQLGEDFLKSQLVLGPPGHGLSQKDVEGYLLEIKNIEQTCTNGFRVTREPAYTDEETLRHFFDVGWVYSERCTYPWRVLRIAPSGEVIPCVGVTLGDVTKGVADNSWNSPEFRHFRKILYREKRFPACFRCCKLK